jgi:hypothetical protein
VSAIARLAAFGAVLALVFTGAAAAGGALDPKGEAKAGAPASHDQGGHEVRQDDDSMTTQSHDAPLAPPVRGLAVAERGLRVVVDDPELRLGRTEQVRFRVVNGSGETVRDFDVEHEKRMHLIVARRDLTGFQHLHPPQAADGGWTAPIRLDSAGSYRLFADFARDGEAYTLASDLRIDGPADLRALPAPEPVAAADGGYEVRLASGQPSAGDETELRFTITRNGETIETEPYLGAGGHLVALREGDLAFLHVHPIGHGDDVEFAATFPTEGRYRLFLQFKRDRRVHTAAFTQEVR